MISYEELAAENARVVAAGTTTFVRGLYGTEIQIVHHCVQNSYRIIVSDKVTRTRRKKK